METEKIELLSSTPQTLYLRNMSLERTAQELLSILEVSTYLEHSPQVYRDYGCTLKKTPDNSSLESLEVYEVCLTKPEFLDLFLSFDSTKNIEDELKKYVTPQYLLSRKSRTDFNEGLLCLSSLNPNASLKPLEEKIKNYYSKDNSNSTGQ